MSDASELRDEREFGQGRAFIGRADPVNRMASPGMVSAGYAGGMAAQARGGIKVTLDCYPKLDASGIRTGEYGTRVLLGTVYRDIPEYFKPTLVITSESGEVGSGTVTGTVVLRPGAGVVAEPADADLDGLAVHALRSAGQGGVTVPMDTLIAIADSQLGLVLVSKNAVVPPVEEVPEEPPVEPPTEEGQPA